LADNVLRWEKVDRQKGRVNDERGWQEGGGAKMTIVISSGRRSWRRRREGGGGYEVGSGVGRNSSMVCFGMLKGTRYQLQDKG